MQKLLPAELEKTIREYLSLKEENEHLKYRNSVLTVVTRRDAKTLGAIYELHRVGDVEGIRNELEEIGFDDEPRLPDRYEFIARASLNLRHSDDCQCRNCEDRRISDELWEADRIENG